METYCFSLVSITQNVEEESALCYNLLGTSVKLIKLGIYVPQSVYHLEFSKSGFKN